jgi:hypothetical protein
MNEDDLVNALRVPFKFQRRPTAVPGDLRIEWRVATLLLILSTCHGKKANLKQLHVLNWSIRSTKTRAAFIGILNGTQDPNTALVRFEPALNRAIDFSVGEGLTERIDGTSISLTNKGLSFISELTKQNDCLLDERTFLQQIKGKTSQKNIDNLLAESSK